MLEYQWLSPYDKKHGNVHESVYCKLVVTEILHGGYVDKGGNYVDDEGMFELIWSPDGRSVICGSRLDDKVFSSEDEAREYAKKAGWEGEVDSLIFETLYDDDPQEGMDAEPNS